MTPIASSAWSWAYCPSGPRPAHPNPTWICLNSSTFNPNYLYEMSYTAQDPLVQGVGFAATRDLVSFLRYGTTAPRRRLEPDRRNRLQGNDRWCVAVRRI